MRHKSRLWYKRTQTTFKRERERKERNEKETNENEKKIIKEKVESESY